VWYGATLVGRLWVTPTWALAARVERFADGDGVLATTASGAPFRTNGASVGIDVRPEPGVLLAHRAERLRRLRRRVPHQSWRVWPREAERRDRDVLALTF